MKFIKLFEQRIQHSRFAVPRYFRPMLLVRIIKLALDWMHHTSLYIYVCVILVKIKHAACKIQYCAGTLSYSNLKYLLMRVDDLYEDMPINSVG